MSLAYIPAFAVVFVILMSLSPTGTPSVEDGIEYQANHNISSSNKKKSTVKNKQETSFKAQYAESSDYQAIFNYIKSTFKSIGSEDAQQISDYLVHYGKENDVDPKFAAALIARESAFKKDAVSSTGAKGLGQIKDFNYKSLKIDDPFNIKQNVSGTTAYIKEMFRNWETIDAKEEDQSKKRSSLQKMKLSLASYYKGFTAVKNDNEKLDSKTSNYVNDILAYYEDIKSFSKESFSD